MINFLEINRAQILTEFGSGREAEHLNIKAKNMRNLIERVQRWDLLISSTIKTISNQNIIKKNIFLKHKMSRLVGIEHMLRGARLGRSLLRVWHSHLGHGRVVVDSTRGRLHCAWSARRRVQLAQSTHPRCQHARACPRGHEAHRNGHLQARLDNSTLPNRLLLLFSF